MSVCWRIFTLCGLASGCAEPFTVERHLLDPPRLAAMGVHDGVARAAIWSGRGAFHTEAPQLEWTLNDAPIGEGFDVVVPGDGRLGLTAVLADGHAVTGEVTVGPWTEVDVLRAEVERPVGKALTLDDRRAVQDPVPVAGSVPSTTMLRLIAVRSSDTPETMRWMFSNPAWSLLELDTASADVVSAKVRWEDGEIDAVIDSAGGLAPGLALSVDGAGGNGWQWFDMAFDIDTPLIRVGGRLLPLDPETTQDSVYDSPSHVVATLVADPDAPGRSGFSLVDVAAGEDLDTDLVAWPGPTCSTGSLLLEHIAEGRCTLDEIDGVRVVLEVR